MTTRTFRTVGTALSSFIGTGLTTSFDQRALVILTGHPFTGLTALCSATVLGAFSKVPNTAPLRSRI